MKRLIRSNSDTNLFFAKENIDIINYNLKKIKHKSKDTILQIENLEKENSKSKVIIESEHYSFSRENSKNDYKVEIESLARSSLRKEFQNLLIKIISCKISFDKKFIEKDFPTYKFEIDIHYEVLLHYLQLLKNSIASAMEMSITLTEYQFTQFLDLESTLNSFDEFLRLFQKHNEKLLNRDVLRIMLNNFEALLTEFNVNIKVIEGLRDTYIFKAIKYITTAVQIKLSNFTNFVHYYTIALNSLVDKLYRFLITCVKSNVDTCILTIIENLIKLKGEYLRDVCLKEPQTSLSFDEILSKEGGSSYHKVQQNFANNSMFTYNKISAIGIYLFNNLNKLIGHLKYPLDLHTGDTTIITSNYQNVKNARKSISKHKNFIWKKFFFQQISLLNMNFKVYSNYFNLDGLLKEFFNYHLITWKRSYTPDDKPEEEKCRICKKIFRLKDMVEHSYYCRERTVLINIHKHLNCQLCRIFQILNNEKDIIIKQMNNSATDLTFRKSNSDYNFHSSDTCHCLFSPSNKLKKCLEKLSDTFSFSHNLKACGDIIELLLSSINKEKQIPAELYEKHSIHIMSLNTIIHLLLKVISTHQMRDSRYDNLFKLILVQLMKKQHVVTCLLTLKDFFTQSQTTLVKKSSKHLSQSLTYIIESEIKEILWKYDGKTYKQNRTNKLAKETLRHSRTISGNKSQNYLSNITKRTPLGKIKDESSVRKISSRLRGLEEDTVRTFSFNRRDEIQSNLKEESYSQSSEDSAQEFQTNKTSTSLGLGDNSNITIILKHSSSSSDFSKIDSENNSSSAINFIREPCTSGGSKRKSLFKNISTANIEANISEENNERVFMRDKTLPMENVKEEVLQTGRDHSEKENTIDEDDSEGKNEDDMKFYELIEIIDDLHYENKIPVDVINEEKIENKMSLDDFKFISFIGKGGFGYVNLYKKKDTGDLFAIKICDISQLESKKVSKMLKREMKILNQVNNEFLVKCFYIFADSKHFYYVMEYLAGGDLDHLMEEVPALSNDIIKLIAAEIIAALSYLHGIGIIHKDLKPENILIGNDGHFKLADFGLSHVGLIQNKFVIKSTDPYVDLVDSYSHIPQTDKNEMSQSQALFSVYPQNFPGLSSSGSTLYGKGHKIPGTPNYTAPETIKGEKPTSAVDLWALGVVLYELFTNRQPFRDESKNKIYDNILSQKIDWDILKECVGDDLDSYDFIQKLLVSNPSQRFTNYDEIKTHPIFNGIFWDNLKNIDNRYIKGYVAKKIKNFKPRKIEDALKYPNQDRNCSPHNNTFCTRRVDNLHIINMREWRKKIKSFSDATEDDTQVSFQLMKK